MTIQDQLINLPGETLFAIAVRKGAKEDFQEVVRMIKSQYLDNPRIITEIIGEPLLKKINEYRK